MVECDGWHTDYHLVGTMLIDNMVLQVDPWSGEVYLCTGCYELGVPVLLSWGSIHKIDAVAQVLKIKL